LSLLGSGIELTIIGMGVVFLSLLALMYIIKFLNKVSDGRGRDEHGPEAKSGTGSAEAAGEVGLVLAAAAGYFLETERAEVFIPEVNRSPESSWAHRARTGRAIPRRPR
jgi:sodium pump decarboxylase gamma subunit